MALYIILSMNRPMPGTGLVLQIDWMYLSDTDKATCKSSPLNVLSGRIVFCENECENQKVNYFFIILSSCDYVIMTCQMNEIA